MSSESRLKAPPTPEIVSPPQIELTTEMTTQITTTGKQLQAFSMLLVCVSFSLYDFTYFLVMDIVNSPTNQQSNAFWWTKKPQSDDKTGIASNSEISDNRIDGRNVMQKFLKK